MSSRFHPKSRQLFPFCFSNITLRADILTFGVTGAVFKIAGKMRRLPAYFDNPVYSPKHFSVRLDYLFFGQILVLNLLLCSFSCKGALSISVFHVCHPKCLASIQTHNKSSSLSVLIITLIFYQLCCSL